MILKSIRFQLAFLAAVTSATVSAAPVSAERAMTFELVGNGGNCEQCEWISAEGTITARTPERFATYLKREGAAPYLMRFHSRGGDIAAAVKLGRMIRAQDYFVVEIARSRKAVDGEWYEPEAGVCLDACVFAFLGGARRLVDEKSEIGFTIAAAQVRTASAATAEKNGTGRDRQLALIAGYLDFLGLSNGILQAFLSSAGPADSLFSRQQIIDLSVDNAGDATRFRAWEASISGPRPALVARSVDARRSVTLECSPRADAPAFQLVLRQKFRGDFAEGQVGNIRESLDGVWVTLAGRSTLIDGSTVKLSASGGDLLARIAMPRDIAAQLSIDGATLFVKPDGLPDAYRDVLRFPSPENPLPVNATKLRSIGGYCGA